MPHPKPRLRQRESAAACPQPGSVLGPSLEVAFGSYPVSVHKKMRGSLVTYRHSETHHLEKHCSSCASLKELCRLFFISAKMSQLAAREESAKRISALDLRSKQLRRCGTRRGVARAQNSESNLLPSAPHGVFVNCSRRPRSLTSAVLDTGRTRRSAAVCA